MSKKVGFLEYVQGPYSNLHHRVFFTAPLLLLLVLLLLLLLLLLLSLLLLLFNSSNINYKAVADWLSLHSMSR